MIAVTVGLLGTSRPTSRILDKFEMQDGLKASGAVDSQCVIHIVRASLHLARSLRFVLTILDAIYICGHTFFASASPLLARGPFASHDLFQLQICARSHDRFTVRQGSQIDFHRPEDDRIR